MVDPRLAMYNTLFKVHTFLKLEVVPQWQKIRKRNAKWNELKGELNAILNIATFLTLADEATQYQ
jgi:hypothetical protein